MMDNDRVLRSAVFNPKVKTYIFILVIFYLLISWIGVVLIPFWLLGLGQWLSKKFYHTLKCELTEKTLKFSKGIVFRIEKTVPLENIQDLSFFGGPLLRSLGLTMIRIETAGGGGGHRSNMMSMIGIENAEDFKMMILAQREKRIQEKNRGFTAGASAPESNLTSEKLLQEIRDELKEMKEILRGKT